MSGMKRFAEEVMTSMGKEEVDAEVLAEAQRRLEIHGFDAQVIDDAIHDLAHHRPEQFWISYTVRRPQPVSESYIPSPNGGVQFNRVYDTGHSMKCKWTAFIHDLENNGKDGHWRIVEESETRKVVAYNDRYLAMTVFQLVTISALVSEPETVGADPVSVGQCIKDGTHLVDCDDDGYCNRCGDQEG